MASMVNQVDISQNNVFKTFPEAYNNQKYYLIKGREPSDAVEISGEKADKNEPLSNHKKRNLAMVISSSALLVGGGALVLMRGLPKNTEKYLESLKKFLEKKLEKSKWNGAESWSEFWVYSIRKVENLINNAQSMNNFTSLKDTAFKNIMDRTPLTSKIHRGITNVFERLARRTVITSYGATGKKFEKMYASFDKLDDVILKSNPDEVIQFGGKSYTKRELVELAKQHRENVKTSVDNFTSDKELLNRYKNIKQATSALYDKIWEQISNGFWSKNNIFTRKEMWQTFLADNQIMKNREIMADSVAAIRNKISYTEADRINIIEGYLKTLKNLVPPSDKEGLNIIKKLEWFLDNPEGLTANSENFVKVLGSLKDRPLEKGLEEVVQNNRIKLRETNINLIKQLVGEQGSGELQQMLAIYKKIAPYELSRSGAENKLRKAVSSFDKSLQTETVEFFNKVRDLQLGSAPTDILTILSSGAMIGYGLTEAADANERKTVMLTAGIPILGTIGTTVVCTTKLISGIVSLGLGSTVGLVLKYTGEYLDKRRQLSAEKNHTNG